MRRHLETVSNNVQEVKSECCGCLNCVQICPFNAIVLETSKEGFVYPKVTENCVSCGKCRNVCPLIIPPDLHRPQKTYAAYANEKNVLKTSSSGGVFAIIAKSVLDSNGVICGCSEKSAGNPEHICIEIIQDLHLLQGSKYVESKFEGILPKIKKYIEDNRLVLFSGTPCQVAAAKKYVGNSKKLLTIDIICHGVPSRVMYKSYLEWLGKKEKGTVNSFVFRSKDKHDWSLTYKALINKGKKLKLKEEIASLSPYYNHFLKGYDYRESCYSCRYACSERAGDITLGDFWGIDRIAPDFFNIDGVSIVLINSNAGLDIWNYVKNDISAREFNFEDVKNFNGQLNNPTVRPKEREKIYELLDEYGYDRIYHEFREPRNEVIDYLKNKVPNRIRTGIKHFLKRIN